MPNRSTRMDEDQFVATRNELSAITAGFLRKCVLTSATAIGGDVLAVLYLQYLSIAALIRNKDQL
jgi:hypothetical protein